MAVPLILACRETNPSFDEPDGGTGSPTDTSSTDDGSSTSGDTTDGWREKCPDDPALVGCYHFEDLGDSILDGSAYGNDGSADTLGTVVGPWGNALDCEQTEAAAVPDSPSLDVTDAVTVAAWVRATGLPREDERAVWVDNSGQYGIMLGPTGDVMCRVLTDEQAYEVEAAFDVVKLGQWSHVGCRYDGAEVELFVDGARVAALDASGSMATGDSEPMTLGSNSPDFDEPCMGELDRVTIFSRAVTDEEMAVLAAR